jgi:hypothetical protein
MTHRQAHWFEKLQVQIATVAAMLAAYAVVWPLVAPGDPPGPLAFLACGEAAKAGTFAVALGALALGVCLLTFSARPEGTMAALLLGLGGLSLRSGSMRILLWAREDDLGTMFWQMLLELMVLAALALAAALLVGVIHAILRGLLGRWGWQDLLEVVSDTDQREYMRCLTGGKDGDAEASARRDELATSLTGGGFARIIVERLARNGSAASATGRGATKTGDAVTRGGLRFLTALGLTLVLVWLLARSSDRGQILFALLAGNFLATLVAYQFFPSRLSWVAWASALVAGAVFYVLAAVGAPHAGGGAWMFVYNSSQALPIDWITAGLGGALLGFWGSSRLHEGGFLDLCEDSPQEGA